MGVKQLNLALRPTQKSDYFRNNATYNEMTQPYTPVPYCFRNPEKDHFKTDITVALSEGCVMFQDSTIAVLLKLSETTVTMNTVGVFFKAKQETIQ